MHKTILTAFALFGLTTAAFAQSPASFAGVDSDASGELSFAELQAVWPDLTQDEFAGADADASNGLSADELNTLQPSAVPAPAAN